MDARPIGVFDSGMGGLGVLKTLREALPHEDFVYYGDNANAPYGDKPPADIIRMSEACADFLVQNGCKAIVVACNTASAAAVEQLRARFDVPIVAMEPAIRPASRMLKDGKVLVLATHNTLTMEHYQNRMLEVGLQDRAINLPGPQLVEYVEEGKLDEQVVQQTVAEMIEPYQNDSIEFVVLGCTHFLHLRRPIENAVWACWPEAQVIDGNDGTARQLCRVLEANGLYNTQTGKGKISFYTSGDETFLASLFTQLMA